MTLWGRFGRCGKGTIGNYLKRRHSFAKMAFADPLYDGIRAVYGVTVAECLDEDKERLLTRLGKSVRELVQDLGDHARGELGQDILIRRLADRAMERGDWKNAPLVITDGRRPLEVEWARVARATVVWVTRTNAPPVRPHHTEAITMLREKHYREGDCELVNDGTAEQVYEQVDAILETLGALEAGT